MHVWHIYPHLVDFYGKWVGKYTFRPMDPSWDPGLWIQAKQKGARKFPTTPHVHRATGMFYLPSLKLTANENPPWSFHRGVSTKSMGIIMTVRLTTTTSTPEVSALVGGEHSQSWWQKVANEGYLVGGFNPAEKY